MERRNFISLLGTAAIIRPLISAAQQPVARIALLEVPAPSLPEFADSWKAFLDGLRQKDWVEGHNIVFDRQFAEGQPERAPEDAAKLIANHPDLIIALATAAMRAARQQTDKIPIVAIGSGDLVKLGLVASLARPGGNLTGFSLEQGEIGGKWLQILQQLRPGMRRVAVLYNPNNPASKFEAEKMLELAPRLGIVLELMGINTPEDLKASFAAMEQSLPEGLVIHPVPILLVHIHDIVSFALTQRLPTISGYDPMASAGLLLSYSQDFVQIWSQAAAIVDKILKGTKPADIPVELPTKFDLVINLKTAQSIGIAVPASILTGATEVIE